ncbi:hypothetical protein LTR53_014865 [Teratosphaeriaceae sp. CCFEE 6253]|nr:hypothetical protein LTR53_014865 [Teratosphaeriaceae sp. CCFEE 6253]
MSLKRLASEVDPTPSRPRRSNVKRAKTAPSDDEHSDSSISSSGSVSEASALSSSPPASHRRRSSVSSLQSARDDESESSLSSSSEESSVEESEDEDTVTLGGPQKPAMAETKHALLSGAQELSARISALLPQLAAANTELEHEGGGYTMEEVEEGEQHIEMNLGLGVLEEKSDDERDDSSEDGDQLSEPDEVPTSSGAVAREPDKADTRFMGKLMGQKKTREKAGVQVLD